VLLPSHSVHTPNTCLSANRHRLRGQVPQPFTKQNAGHCGTGQPPACIFLCQLQPHPAQLQVVQGLNNLTEGHMPPKMRALNVSVSNIFMRFCCSPAHVFLCHLVLRAQKSALTECSKGAAHEVPEESISWQKRFSQDDREPQKPPPPAHQHCWALPGCPVT
jgi:hypothetical protein